MRFCSGPLGLLEIFDIGRKQKIKIRKPYQAATHIQNLYVCAFPRILKPDDRNFHFLGPEKAENMWNERRGVRGRKLSTFEASSPQRPLCTIGTECPFWLSDSAEKISLLRLRFHILWHDPGPCTIEFPERCFTGQGSKEDAKAAREEKAKI